jgi:hypothetical protein
MKAYPKTFPTTTNVILPSLERVKNWQEIDNPACLLLSKSQAPYIAFLNLYRVFTKKE